MHTKHATFFFFLKLNVFYVAFMVFNRHAISRFEAQKSEDLS